MVAYIVLVSVLVANEYLKRRVTKKDIEATIRSQELYRYSPRGIVMGRYGAIIPDWIEGSL